MSQTTCPECKTPLSGTEMICPVCLMRLPAPEDDLIIPKSVSLSKKTGSKSKSGATGPVVPNLDLSPAQQAKLRFQFFPWRKFIIGALTIMLIFAGMVASLAGLWLLMGQTPPKVDFGAEMARADQLYQQRNFEDAAAAYQSLLTSFPQSDAAYNGLGWSYYQLTQDQDAYNAFNSAVQLNPQHVEAQLGLGQSAYYLNKNVEAISALHSVIALNPEKTKAYAYLGATYFRQKMYAEALGPLEDAVWRDPTDVESLALLGKTLLLTNRPADAIMPLERALELTPQDNDLHQYLAQAYSQVNDYDEAIRHARMALKTSPQNLQLATLLGEALYNYGDPEGAASTLTEATAYNQDGPLLATLYQVLGQVHYGRGDYQTAISLLHTAITLNGASAQATADLGRSYLAVNQMEEGCTYLTLAARQDPAAPDIQADMARCSLNTPQP